jgi:hypothetical protein
MYLKPLARVLDRQNRDGYDDQRKGIFNRYPEQSVVLLVDLKTAGEPTCDQLFVELQSLRDGGYLTYWNGTERISRPITVVANRHAPFHSVLALNTTHRYIFMDAPLEALYVHDDMAANPPWYFYNASNSYYASTRVTLVVAPLQ